jgi:molecular chaperone GrpE
MTAKKSNPNPDDPRYAETGEAGTGAGEDGFDPSGGEETIRQLQEENDRLRDQMLRARAEFENYKRRRAGEMDQMTTLAAEGLITDLLPILDDFDLLIGHAGDTSAPTPLLDGAVKIRQKLIEQLEKRGLTTIEAEGQEFDPDMHEALMQQPSMEHEPGTVIAVHQKGYRLGDKLLRPARVVVAAEAGGE